VRDKETDTGPRRAHDRHLRSDYRFMEPDELSPEERLERVVEILTEGILTIVPEPARWAPDPVSKSTSFE
jgi:hypothetical protein